MRLSHTPSLLFPNNKPVFTTVALRFYLTSRRRTLAFLRQCSHTSMKNEESAERDRFSRKTQTRPGRVFVTLVERGWSTKNVSAMVVQWLGVIDISSASYELLQACARKVVAQGANNALPQKLPQTLKTPLILMRVITTTKFNATTLDRTPYKAKPLLSDFRSASWRCLHATQDEATHESLSLPLMGPNRL